MKKERIINQLRRKFPGKWSYDAQLNRWVHEEGWYIEPVSQMAPRYDGDDDSFITRYRRSDTYELMDLFNVGAFNL